MNCPICGLHVCAVYHEWDKSKNLAFFEYHHSLPDNVDEEFRRKPCELRVPISQGLQRYEEEWKEMYRQNSESGEGDASQVSQTV